MGKANIGAQLVKGCILWKGPQAEAREEHEEIGAAEQKHYELTQFLSVTPIPVTPRWLSSPSHWQVQLKVC